MRNPVARHLRTFNRATVERDKTKYHRPAKNDLLAEWYEEDEGWWDEEYPAIANPKEFETPCISANINTSSFINRRQQ